MKKCITDYDLFDKKVIIRLDLNVPISNGVITDDNRIKKSLKTINYAIEKGAKVIIMSHLGRIKSEEDKASNSLQVVALRLSELLFRPVKFVGETRGSILENEIANMQSKDVILVENTRFEDIENKESGNDDELARYWASLADIFIDDAFALIHRAHASNVGIAKYLPNGIGFLIEEELDKMLPMINEPKKPFTIILGGAKVSDKIGFIDNLIDQADYVLIGGGMAYTFLYALGYNVGKSLLDKDKIDYVKKLLSDYKDKIILPLDSITSTSIDGNNASFIKNIDEFNDDDIGVDIGPKTIELFKKYTTLSKQVIWNGPMGVFEVKAYSKGTYDILLSLVGDRLVMIAGGDTAAAAINMGFSKDFTHISTGGGASLAVLANEDLPALDIINEK